MFNFYSRRYFSSVVASTFYSPAAHEKFVAAGRPAQLRILKSLRDGPYSSSNSNIENAESFQEDNSTDSVARAWELFNNLVAEGKADAHQFEVMLKACYSSAEQRQLIEEVLPKQGIAPTEVMYRTLANMLRMEGKSSKSVATEIGSLLKNVKLAKHGKDQKVQQDEKTVKALNRSSEVVSRMRTARLANWLKLNGSKDSTTGQAAAWKMFNGLVDAGKANEYHFGTMLHAACHTSEEQKELIEKVMPKVGVEPGAQALTCLAHTLVVEGDVNGAIKTIERLPKMNIDRKAKEVLALAKEGGSEKLQNVRAAKIERLSRMETETSKKVAWNILDASVDAASDLYIFHKMLPICMSSADFQRLKEAVTKAGLEVDYHIQKGFVDILRSEGKEKEANKEEQLMQDEDKWVSMGFQPSRAKLLRNIVLQKQSIKMKTSVDEEVYIARGGDVQALKDKASKRREKTLLEAQESADARTRRIHDSYRYGQPVKRHQL
eukprot:g3870.t1